MKRIIRFFRRLFGVSNRDKDLRYLSESRKEDYERPGSLYWKLVGLGDEDDSL